MKFKWPYCMNSACSGLIPIIIPSDHQPEIHCGLRPAQFDIFLPFLPGFPQYTPAYKNPPLTDGGNSTSSPNMHTSAAPAPGVIPLFSQRTNFNAYQPLPQRQDAFGVSLTCTKKIRHWTSWLQKGSHSIHSYIAIYSMSKLVWPWLYYLSCINPCHWHSHTYVHS